ncbi:Cysteine protease [Pantoea sp. AS-PWVM4]|nr:Cysteine protease [Pantoea sp. AS-PWVM4]
MTRSAIDNDGYAHQLVVENPLTWLKSQPNQHTLKLVIYAHGGLNNQDDSITRIRVLAPYFVVNGIYPLFLTWKTGAGETLTDIMQDWAKKVLPDNWLRSSGWLNELGETKDLALEALARVLGKGVWSEMRENAEEAAVSCVQNDRLLDLLARKLIILQENLNSTNTKLEIHCIGHSAGSILLGHLLERFIRDDLLAKAPPISTLTLYAAACSVRFAVEKFLPAADNALFSLSNLWLYYLSDDNEKADGLPTADVPMYGKSLLYLVSRALDDHPNMPILGMCRALDPKFNANKKQWAEEEMASLEIWQNRWGVLGSGNKLAIQISDPKVRITRANDQSAATHGSFDNNIDILTQTIERIMGHALPHPLEWLDY